MSVKTKAIWLDTRAGTANEERTRIIFHNLPLIQIKKRSYIKVIALTTIRSADPNLSSVVKLVNVKYNQSVYYNSDGDANPTIYQYNTTSGINIDTGIIRLEIPPQDITNLEIAVGDLSGIGLTDRGTPLNIIFCLIIEEAGDQ